VGDVKNQWFGDKRDYFKFDLWLEVAEKVEAISQLTYIPMLTRSAPPYEKGKRRERLYDFLKYWHVPECRSITRMRDFLGAARFDYRPYRDNDEAGFRDGSWDAYFRDIQEDWLRDAAVLIDPDTGISPKKPDQPEKFVTLGNIAEVVGKSSGNSVVLVFQYLQKTPNSVKVTSRRRLKTCAEGCPKGMGVGSSGGLLRRPRKASVTARFSWPLLMPRCQTILSVFLKRTQITTGLSLN